MTEVNQEIREQIKQAVTGGDLKRLKTLAGQFPDSFASFGGGQPEDNLVDLAWNQRHNDAVVYLIVEHGFEVGIKFKTEEKHYFGAEAYAFDSEPQKLHKTMEILANAVVGHHPLDYVKCYTLKDWAENGGKWPYFADSWPISTEFSRQIVSGNLRRFVTQKLGDGRSDQIFSAHSVRMLDAIKDCMSTIEEKYKNDCKPEIGVPMPSAPNSGRGAG